MAQVGVQKAVGALQGSETCHSLEGMFLNQGLLECPSYFFHGWDWRIISERAPHSIEPQRAQGQNQNHEPLTCLAIGRLPHTGAEPKSNTNACPRACLAVVVDPIPHRFEP